MAAKSSGRTDFSAPAGPAGTRARRARGRRDEQADKLLSGLGEMGKEPVVGCPDEAIETPRAIV
jgi:hypothetical protein